VTHFHDPDTGRSVSRYLGLGLREVETGGAVEGTAPLAPHLLDADGFLRAGPLLAMADSAGGVCGGLASLPRWVVSTNLVARIATVEPRGPLRVVARVLRTGRHAAVTAIETVDDGTGSLVSEVVLTSAALQPAGGPPDYPRPLSLPVTPAEDGLPEPDEYYGVRALHDEDGARGVELDLTDTVRNPWGILHGGVTTSLVESAAARALDRGAALSSVVLHFLHPGRTGPVRAAARSVGTGTAGTVLRVEVRDRGATDRLLAVAVVTAPTPGAGYRPRP
jgi:uncharacterized protein (TIGR00369 family)